MRLKDELPKYAISQGHPRGWIVQRGPQGNLLCYHKTRHARALGFPSGSIPNPYSQTCGISRRDFLAFIARYWKSAFPDYWRATWSATAATCTIQNYKGAMITPNGFELYAYIMASYGHTLRPSGKAFQPNYDILDIAPPLIANQPPALTNLLYTAPYYGGFTCTFDAPAPNSPGIFTILIGPPARQGMTPYPRKFRTCNTGICSPTGIGIHYTGVMPIFNVIETPPRPGPRNVRLTAMPQGPTWFPPPWAEFTLALA